MPDEHTHESNQMRYWRFYWPLALMGLAMLSSRQFQNRALASYQDAERELTTFAIAFSTFAMFHAVLVFIPQMTNRLVRSRGAMRRCFRFTLVLGLVVTALIAILGFSPPGRWFLVHVMNLNESLLTPVTSYLRFFLPLALMNAMSQYNRGLLTQAHRTGIVTMLQVGRLGLVGVLLLAGWHAGWSPVTTLVVAQVGPAAAVLVAAYFLRLTFYVPPGCPADEKIRYGDIVRFFWPVALTGVMFALSRPILFSFLLKLEDSETVVASVAVAFSFAMIFHNPVNGCRDVFITFGREDLAGVRRFAIKVATVATALIVISTATPLLPTALSTLLNVPPDLLATTSETFWPLCLLPLVVLLRNYYHGRALIERRTIGMGLGGIARNLTVLSVSSALYATGHLNHVTAAATLVSGFAAEAVVVMTSTLYMSARENAIAARAAVEVEEIVE